MTPVIEARARNLRPISGAVEWKRELSRLSETLPDGVPTNAPSTSHHRILIPMLVGASDLFALREGLIAHALRMRGADVLFVLCDGLTACDARTFDTDDPEQCSRCFPEGVDNLTRFGHTVLPLSSFIPQERVEALRAEANACPPEELLSSVYAGIDLGKHVFTSTLRYFRSAKFDPDDPVFVAKARQYLGSALVMTEAVRNAYRTLAPDKLFSSHGMYATWGPWAAMARAMNIRCDIYGGGWRRNTLICQHDAERFAHADDIWERFQDVALSAEENERLTQYLASRETNSGDAFRYFDTVDRDAESWLERVGASGEWKSRVCLFTNVGWDAARYRQEGVFGDMFGWVVETAKHYRNHPDHLLLIKVHPAESKFREKTPPEWTVVRVLERALGALPKNVKLILGEDDISNHALGHVIDLALVHTSSVGFEMALLGRPVLTTGGAVHYEKDGLVLRPDSVADYFEALARLFRGETPPQPDAIRARRYAYTIYFRKSIPFDVIDVEGWTPKAIAIDSLAELAPGRFAGLDALCDGILNGAPLAVE